MKRSLSATIRLITIITTALAMLSLGAMTTAAQDAPVNIDFTISSFTCDVDPGDVSVAAGNIPDSCTPDAGITFNLALEDSTAVGSCTTDGGGICKISAPNEAVVVATMSDAPTGTTPRENPMTTTNVTEFAGALFINLPESAPVPEVPAPAPEVPTTLPTTGSGTAIDSANLLLATLSVAAAGSAFTAMAIRRRYS